MVLHWDVEWQELSHYWLVDTNDRGDSIGDTDSTDDNTRGIKDPWKSFSFSSKISGNDKLSIIFNKRSDCSLRGQ